MKKLGIRFSDNDFTCTWRAILNVIAANGLSAYSHLNKAQLAELLNETSYAMYLLAQNRYRYDPGLGQDDYLHIEEKHIFIDDEVTAFIKEKVWDNGEFHYLDEQTYGGYIGSI